MNTCIQRRLSNFSVTKCLGHVHEDSCLAYQTLSSIQCPRGGIHGSIRKFHRSIRVEAARAALVRYFPSGLTYQRPSSNLFGGVGHVVVGLVLLGDSTALGVAVDGFLLLLDEIAEAAAAGGGDVDQAAALEVVLLTDVGALEGHGDPVETDAGGAEEHEALLERC